MSSKVGLQSYLVFKLFEIYRDRMLPIINEYRREGGDRDDVYRHIFLAPESYSKKRAFQVRGVLSPFVCMWASSPLKYAKDFYARSVLPRYFEYEVDGEHRVDKGFLYDYEMGFELSSSSFFADFRAAVNQDLLDLDRLRYVSLNVDELLPGFSCVAELMLEDMTQKENVDQAGGNRSFDLGARYTLRVTLPVLSKPELYIERVRLFLGDRMVWMKAATDLKVGETGVESGGVR